MVACLSPGEYQESVNTVSLASRSRQISNYVSSAHKEDTPTVKIDMEAKLHAWLESKGKTKNTQRIGALGSPYPSKTPISKGTTKEQNSCQNSTKPKPTIDQGVATPKPRNLFDSGAPVFSAMNDMCLHNEEHEACKNIKQDRELKSSVDENYENHSVIPPDERDRLNPWNAIGINESGEVKDEKPITGRATMPESTATSAVFCGDEFLKEKAASTPCTDSNESPPIHEKIRALQSSLRKVLSPINSISSTKPFDDFPSKDRLCLVFFEPKTPKTPYVLTYDSDEIQATNTPFDKFSAQGYNLKSSLVQEYLAFLNSASKVDLLRLKGIGNKRAEGILQLRETSPLKSLYDLQKIGLSSKQVNDIFRRAARGIFE